MSVFVEKEAKKNCASEIERSCWENEFAKPQIICKHTIVGPAATLLIYVIYVDWSD